MSKVQAEWHRELAPCGDETWAKPALSLEEADRKLKLRQAIADDTLRDEDPEARANVVKKAMKDGDFDGSDLDLLDKQIDADAARSALRRAAGDWHEAIAEQHAPTAQPRWQTARIELYLSKACPHCDRARTMLCSVGAYWTEYDIDVVTTNIGGANDVLRRARHAAFETVPQLYVLRSPPLKGRPAEALGGGADDLERELQIPETTAFSFKGRISDPDFL
mmetsp:Transcript_17948/g.58062  ORF Transcript_17948/g.58062 Transcript_17948/m.58062 type:complete len:221 (-) Transcript_17948:539-1201(-)